MAKKTEQSPNFRDLPWSEDKVKVFKAVKALKESTKEQVVKKSGVSNAGHYLYHGRPEAGGWVTDVKYEGDATRYFKLTAKGERIDADKERKAYLEKRGGKAANKDKPKAAAKKGAKAARKSGSKRKAKASAPAAQPAPAAEPALA